MVIDDIHNDIDVIFVIGFNQFLEFFNSLITIIGISAIRPFQDVIVLRIITPVKGSIHFIVLLVIERKDLNSVHAHFFNVVKTGSDGRVAFRILSSFFIEAFEGFGILFRPAPSIIAC